MEFYKVASFDRRLLSLIEKKQTRQMSKEVMSIIARENLYNVADRSNNTLLHMAVKSNNSELAKYLIDSGSRFDVKNDFEETPLTLAVTNNCEAIAKILIELGGVIPIPHFAEFEVLFKIKRFDLFGIEDEISVIRKFIKIVARHLPRNNEDMAHRILKYGWDLIYVILLRNADVTKLILDRKYCRKVNGTDRLGRTALHIAVRTFDVENLNLVLNYNANINVTDFYGLTPFHYLHFFKNPDSSERLQILKMLFNRIDATSNVADGINCILSSENKEVIKLALRTDINLFFTDDFRGTVVHALAQNKNPGVIEELRGKDFNVNAKNKCGSTPLMSAVLVGNANAVEYLLNEGADIETFDNINYTPLLRAISGIDVNIKGCKETAQILLEHGANIENKIAVKTVIDAVSDCENFTSAELVLAHLALQEALGKSITQLSHNKINSHDRLKIYFESCKQQLSMEIYQSITLFDVLAENERKLERRARNEKFLLNLQNFMKEIERSYYFYNVLQKRLTKATRTAKLRRQAAHFVSKLMKMDYNRFPLIADDIVSYLELQDMKNLIDSSV